MAERIAQATLDWRDVDDRRRVNGAERNGLIEDRRAVLPRNVPLESIEGTSAVSM